MSDSMQQRLHRQLHVQIAVPYPTDREQ